MKLHDIYITLAVPEPQSIKKRNTRTNEWITLLVIKWMNHKCVNGITFIWTTTTAIQPESWTGFGMSSLYTNRIIKNSILIQNYIQWNYVPF